MTENTSFSIVRVDARVLSLHNPTLATSYGAGKVERQHVFVRVTAQSGAWGIGEGSPLPHFTGEHAPTISWAIENVLGPALLGASVMDMAGIQARLERAMPHNGTAKNALVTAAYDLAGKMTGQPVCNLLGGRLRERIPTAWGVGILPPEQTAEEARRLVTKGCATVKLKVGVDPERDIAAVALTRQAIGPNIPIRCDANQGYHPKDALRALRGFRDYNIQYLEQPVAAWDLESLAWLRRQSDVRIAADESLYGPFEAMHLIRHEAVDVFVIKLIKVQGLFRARQVLAIAEAAGIQCNLVSPYETSIGAAANVHLAAAAPNVPFACEIGVDADLRDDPGTGLLSDGGDMLVPTGPGLGVDLRRDLFSV
jgi:L-Ala-D/L-Glu epimerase